MLLLASCGQEGKSPVVNSTESLQKVGTIVPSHYVISGCSVFFPLTDLPPGFKRRTLPQHCVPQMCSLTLSFLVTCIGNGEAESLEESREEVRTEAREPREACRVLGGCLGGGRLRAGASGEKAGRGVAAPASLRAVAPGEAAAFPLSEAVGGQTSGKAKMI